MRNALLADSPERRRLLAIGCIGLAAALGAYALAAVVVSGFLSVAHAVYVVDPTYLYGPISLLGTASLVIVCLPQQRIDHRPRYLPLRIGIVLLGFAAPLSEACWEYGYAYVPAGFFGMYSARASQIVGVVPLALALSFILLGETAEKWGLKNFLAPLYCFAAGWFAVAGAYWLLFFSQSASSRTFATLLLAILLTTFADSIALLLCLGIALIRSARKSTNAS
jgi:hypothetical protein